MTPLQKVNIIAKILKRKLPILPPLEIIELAVKIVEMTYEDDKVSQG